MKVWLLTCNARISANEGFDGLHNVFYMQPSILPSRGPPSAHLLRYAGKYFKRWDSQEKMFVSNRKNVYPDD
jgi:hypothetical protein